MTNIQDLTIIFRGAGDIASGAALRLYRAGLRRLILLEQARPMALRRQVCFSEAVYEGQCRVEEVLARRAFNDADIASLWAAREIPVLVDPEGESIARWKAEVLIDATLSKRNRGIKVTDAPLVIGIGPGFEAGRDVHCVVESKRGAMLGRLYRSGGALTNTGTLEGVDRERLLRAPCAGLFETALNIGQKVSAGQTVGFVDGQPVTAAQSGTLRGLLRSATEVRQHAKVGDIESRPDVNIYLCSDKSLAIGGALLEAVLSRAVDGSL